MFIFFLAGMASGLLVGLTVIVCSLAGRAWWQDRQAKYQVIDGEWKVIQ